MRWDTYSELPSQQLPSIAPLGWRIRGCSTSYPPPPLQHFLSESNLLMIYGSAPSWSSNAPPPFYPPLHPAQIPKMGLLNHPPYRNRNHNYPSSNLVPPNGRIRYHLTPKPCSPKLSWHKLNLIEVFIIIPKILILLILIHLILQDQLLNSLTPPIPKYHILHRQIHLLFRWITWSLIRWT